MDYSDFQAFCRRLREIRASKGLQQDHVAQRISLSKSFLCDLEQGRRGMTDETARKLSEVYGVHIEVIRLWRIEPLPPTYEDADSGGVQ